MSSTICKNLAEPLFLPITNYNISADGLAAPSWGIAIGMGMPEPQWFSLTLSSILDHTILLNADHCLITDNACLAETGGIYNPESSTTETLVPTVSDWNGTLGGDDASDYFFYNDVLTLGENGTSVWGFPFTTDDGADWAGTGILGIGTNSSFIQAVVDSGVAPSRSWGLWVGKFSPEEQQPGLLMIGGYDDERVAHDFSTFPSRDECTTCITIENLAWVDENGTTTPLTNDTVPNFQVSLQPFAGSIQIPEYAFDAFGLATDGIYNYDLGYYWYSTSNVPNGSLTFSIKNGYSTSIPASEIFKFIGTYDSDGSYVIADEEDKIAKVSGYVNENPEDGKILGTWGFPFMTMNYLVMDVEEQQFRLSEAIRQDWGNEGGVSPRKLCSGLVPPDSKPKKTNVGALVGEIIGGVAVLVIIVVAIFFCCRRRRNRRSKQSSDKSNAAQTPQTYAPVAPIAQQPYSPAGAYPIPYSPQGYPSYSDQPSPPAMMQHEYPKADPAGYQVYTAPAELPSPERNPAEWRGSEISSDTNATRGVSGTFSTATTYNQRSELS